MRCHNMCIARAVGMMQPKVLNETRSIAHIIPFYLVLRLISKLSGYVRIYQDLWMRFVDYILV